MASEPERTLDQEGVPDLDGPLPEKARTGDPQEGETPPGDRPRASVDWGVTAEEERAGEPIGVRVERELPDLGVRDPVDEVAEDLGLEASTFDDREEAELRGRELVGDDLLADDEKDMVALAPEIGADEGQTAEEAAMHIVDE